MVQADVRAPLRGTHASVPLIPMSEIALTGIYEVSKILDRPGAPRRSRSRTSLTVMSSFMQMRHGVIALLADDDIPDITVGAGWNEGTDSLYRSRAAREGGRADRSDSGTPGRPRTSARTRCSAQPVWLRSMPGPNSRVSSSACQYRSARRVVGTLTIDRIWDDRSVFRLDSDVRFLTMIANLIGQTVQLHRLVARDRERMMAERHRLQKELSELKPVRERKKTRIEGIIGDSKASFAH